MALIADVNPCFHGYLVPWFFALWLLESSRVFMVSRSLDLCSLAADVRLCFFMVSVVPWLLLAHAHVSTAHHLKWKE